MVRYVCAAAFVAASMIVSTSSAEAQLFRGSLFERDCVPRTFVPVTTVRRVVATPAPVVRSQPAVTSVARPVATAPRAVTPVRRSRLVSDDAINGTPGWPDYQLEYRLGLSTDFPRY